jgi:hypothetical protein
MSESDWQREWSSEWSAERGTKLYPNHHYLAVETANPNRFVGFRKSRGMRLL